MKNVQFFEFTDAGSLVGKLAGKIAELLTQGIVARGEASLAVSGGRTPVPLFMTLSDIELEWKKVKICLVDERWVDPEDEDSNERMVREYLLRGRAARAHFTGMKTSGAARAGEIRYAAALSAFSWPLNVVILGMGNDGHTASLFPGATALREAVSMTSGKRCLAIFPSHNISHERMTLTLPAILDSRHIIVHIQGDQKKKVYTQACQDGPAKEMPIRYILRQQQVPVSVYWAP